jgi:dTDP-4-dehydrorhamnose reductase
MKTGDRGSGSSKWKNILVTGGSGRLGTELKKHLKAQYPTKEQLDVTRCWGVPDCDLLVHMASYTNVDEAEKDKSWCFRVNVLGTNRLLEKYPDAPFVFISTEHVNADGTYFNSKLIGELLVKNLSKSYLIIRTLFKPNPWPWEFAFEDQYTQGDYVDVIAPLIAKEIKEWDGVSKSIMVGTGRKTMYELAKRTKSDVKPNSVNDLLLKRPHDYI